MTGSSAPIGNNGSGTLHDGFPVRVRHISDKHITAFNLIHICNRLNYFGYSRTDPVTDTSALANHRSS